MCVAATVALAAVLLRYRKTKLLKASQLPMIAMLMAAMVFACVRISLSTATLPTQKMCQVRYWFGHLAYIVMPVFMAKTLRVHLVVNAGMRKVRRKIRRTVGRFTGCPFNTPPPTVPRLQVKIKTSAVFAFAAALVAVMLVLMIIMTPVRVRVRCSSYSHPYSSPCPSLCSHPVCRPPGEQGSRVQHRRHRH